MLLRTQDLDECGICRLFADGCCFGMVATATWNFLCQANSIRPVGVMKTDSGAHHDVLGRHCHALKYAVFHRFHLNNAGCFC